jgi:hypothetical protein
MAKEKMTKAEIQKRHHEIMVELDQIEERASKENRAFTAEENAQYDALVREDNRLHLDIQGMLDERELAKFNEQKSKNTLLREVLQKCVKERENATTILQNAVTTGDDKNMTANIETSGAVPLTIHELIDTKVEGLELPADLRMLTGVVGNEIWPYSIDDVEFTVAGEVEKIDEHALNFAKLSANPERVAASIAVSNRAIDNAAFDLLGFVTYKFQKGIAKFKALHVYSHAAFDNALKSPFALVDVEEIVLDENIGKNLAKKVAEMYDLGFEGVPYLTMDKVIETELRFTKAIPGQNGDRTVIMDGKCVGYPYTVSKYINTTLDSEGKPVQDSDRYIGIGHYGYLSLEQHGEVRFTVDATSAEVAKRNTTVLTLNTEFSLTELSSKVNGGTGKPQAFKLLKVVEAAPTTL